MGSLYNEPREEMNAKYNHCDTLIKYNNETNVIIARWRRYQNIPMEDAYTRHSFGSSSTTNMEESSISGVLKNLE
jgi:hypothetical protein